MRHLLPYLLLSEHVHRMAFPTRNRLRINIQINSTDALHYYKYNNAQKFTEIYRNPKTMFDTFPVLTFPADGLCLV